MRKWNIKSFTLGVVITLLMTVCVQPVIAAFSVSK